MHEISPPFRSWSDKAQATPQWKAIEIRILSDDCRQVDRSVLKLHLIVLDHFRNAKGTVLSLEHIMQHIYLMLGGECLVESAWWSAWWKLYKMIGGVLGKCFIRLPSTTSSSTISSISASTTPRTPPSCLSSTLASAPASTLLSCLSSTAAKEKPLSLRCNAHHPDYFITAHIFLIVPFGTSTKGKERGERAWGPGPHHK